jgi:hypothetical protein
MAAGSRGPWENGAMTADRLGHRDADAAVLARSLHYSFVTILAGTLGFVIVSHFPE